MRKGVLKILFISTKNSSRSLIAEGCLAHLGAGRFKVFSAGHPDHLADQPSGVTLATLQQSGFAIGGLRSKSWSQFARLDAERMDFVVCLDRYLLSDLPTWPGQPDLVLWHYAPLTNEVQAQKEHYAMLVSIRRRIELLVALHQRTDSRADLRDELREMAG
ncbi:MAG: hypothetical protein IH961_07250 [Chloroflexi bacterium]|nr:hypothetical protein [Chloroflexota bacterium]